jgi:S1-C subfamily serine protease
MAQPPNDLALLRIDLRKAAESIEGQHVSTVIALRPPAVGENTLALGYPYQIVTESFRFDSELRASRGIVEEVHNETRNAFVTAPSFRVTGRYEGGMSGGPVYDEKQGVVGVVSRGMTPIDGQPPYGIAQSIGCMAELKIELQTDDGSVFEYTVPEMAHIGLIKLVGDHNVNFDRNESGLRLSWS